MSAEDKKDVKVRFGLCTDSHYADVDERNGRNYRDSLGKLKKCVAFMNKSNVDFLAQLGDFKDQDEPPIEEKTLKYLRTVEDVFDDFKGPVYHALGNHDIDSISKKQFQDLVTNTGISKEKTYYSFDKKGVHFIVLDANFKSDGSEYDKGNFDWKDTNIPPEELDWLEKDLKATKNPVVILIHHELDGPEYTCVNNAKDVRKILEDSGNVLAVFQGHDHKGFYSHRNGIHYCTMRPVVGGVGEENNAYAIVEVLKDNSIKITGYGKEKSRVLSSLPSSE